MTEDRFTAIVAKDLEDLIPVFMTNRQKEVGILRAAAAAGDFEQLRQLGHRMKGVGNSYGFAPVSEMGKRIEDAARASDAAASEAIVAEYEDYLARVKIVYE